MSVCITSQLVRLSGMTNTNNNSEKIGNNYGAAFTPEEIAKFLAKFHSATLKPTSNNLAMRQQLSGLGFSRVSRQFASELMELVK